MKFFSRHCLPITFTIDDNIWVSSEKEACSVSFSYVEVHWLKLAPGLNKVPGGKTTPHNIFFGPILPKFEENFEIGFGDFERCSMLPVRKTSVDKSLHLSLCSIRTSPLSFPNDTLHCINFDVCLIFCFAFFHAFSRGNYSQVRVI